MKPPYDEIPSQSFTRKSGSAASRARWYMSASKTCAPTAPVKMTQSVRLRASSGSIPLRAAWRRSTAAPISTPATTIVPNGWIGTPTSTTGSVKNGTPPAVAAAAIAAAITASDTRTAVAGVRKRRSVGSGIGRLGSEDVGVAHRVAPARPDVGERALGSAVVPDAREERARDAREADLRERVFVGRPGRDPRAHDAEPGRARRGDSRVDERTPRRRLARRHEPVDERRDRLVGPAEAHDREAERPARPAAARDDEHVADVRAVGVAPVEIARVADDGRVVRSAATLPERVDRAREASDALDAHGATAGGSAVCAGAGRALERAHAVEELHPVEPLLDLVDLVEVEAEVDRARVARDEALVEGARERGVDAAAMERGIDHVVEELREAALASGEPAAIREARELSRDAAVAIDRDQDLATGGIVEELPAPVREGALDAEDAPEEIEDAVLVARAILAHRHAGRRAFARRRRSRP